MSEHRPEKRHPAEMMQVQPGDGSQIRELDVRPMLAAGQEPFEAIMAAVGTLALGECLRLFAPFRPEPLFAVMAHRGYSASDRRLDNGDWETVFAPMAGDAAEAAKRLAAGSSLSAACWPPAIDELDLSDAAYPELEARVLGTLDQLEPGDVLFVLMAGEPVRLLPALASRRHEWAGNFDASGRDYRLLIRRGQDGRAA